MKSENYVLMRYDADEGKVFDWKDLSNHRYTDEEGNVVQGHLYVKTLFIGEYDNIENYVEVEEVENEN